MGSLSENLLEFLKKRQEDRGVMANLRCALVESKRRRAWPLLAWCDGIGNDFRALTIQHVAGYFATHPKECGEGNFGDSCRRLMDEEEMKKIAQGDTGPLSSRFQHLLAAEGDEIFGRVMRFVFRCKSGDVPINYSQLFNDLMQWQHAPDAVRTRWAKSFWAPKVEEEP
jgi:CRISPR system Cascade subunit CasB